MKKALSLFLSLIMLSVCTSCKSNNINMEPQTAQMKSICELAVMDCYYHNVAKIDVEDAAGIWLWKKDKRIWIEYSGIVELGVDASLVSMEIKDDKVTITIPGVKVLDATVDSNSLTDDSFYIDSDSAKGESKDSTEAFAIAQEAMKESAENNTALLNSALERTQLLLENYVKNIGEAIGKEYTIEWVYIDSPTDSGEIKAPALDTEENQD